MTQIQRIEELIPCLPKDEIKYADKFFKSRNFESLREIVSSTIKKIRRNLNKAEPREDYKEVDMDKLETLYFEVDLYCSQLMLDDEEY